MSDRNPETTTEAHAVREDFERRVLEYVEEILESSYDSLEIRNRVYNLAFRENDILPKRDRRPKTTTAFVAEQVHRAHDGNSDDRAVLVKFALVVAEYGDILDDIVDGDVSDGHENEALLVTQLLMPVLTKLLHQLGDEAVAYWSGHATALVEAPLVDETETPPSAEVYLHLLEKQTSLRSAITGLAAVASNGNAEAIERAERVGEAIHHLMQFSTDLFQYGDDDDPWNAVALFDQNAFTEQADTFRSELANAVDPYPDLYSDRIERIWDIDYQSRYQQATIDETS